MVSSAAEGGLEGGSGVGSLGGSLLVSMLGGKRVPLAMTWRMARPRRPLRIGFERKPSMPLSWQDARSPSLTLAVMATMGILHPRRRSSSVAYTHGCVNAELPLGSTWYDCKRVRY